MTVTAPPREDIKRAFASLTIDIPADTPPEAFVGIVRQVMARYGGADPEKALDGVTVTPVDAGGVPAEWVATAQARDDRRIVFLHGGGWIAGGLPVYRLVGAVLARASGCPVLVVDYRLAPENAYPVPLDDCIAAYRFACANGPAGEGEAPVCVAGDSAGANLTAALTVRTIEEGLLVPERVALLCGVLDLSQTDYVARNDPLCNAGSLAGSFAAYAQGKVEADHPHLSPVNASDAVFAAFPPTLVQASADEFLFEGGRRFANKMFAAGRRCVLSAWPLMPHSWQCFVDSLPEAEAALGEVADFFTRGR